MESKQKKLVLLLAKQEPSSQIVKNMLKLRVFAYLQSPLFLCDNAQEGGFAALS